jgi:hypothetical protein
MALINEQPVSSSDWHTKARVQAMVVAHPVRDDWQVMPVADRLTRKRGTDIVAVREADALAIEVKGFSGRGSSDPVGPEEGSSRWAGQGLARTGRSGSNADTEPDPKPGIRQVDIMGC